MRKNTVLNAVLLLSVTSALVASIITFRIYRQQNELVPERTIDNPRAIIASGQIEGSPTAQFKVAVFSDYECSSCRGLYVHLRTLLGQFPDLFAVSWHHIALPGHSLAEEAAGTAICAERQHLFNEVHSIMFRDQELLPELLSSRLVQEVTSLDPALLQSCLQEPSTSSRLEQDRSIARQLRIVVTPAILVDSTLYIGNSKGLRKLLSHRLREIAATVDSKSIILGSN